MKLNYLLILFAALAISCGESSSDSEASDDISTSTSDPVVTTPINTIPPPPPPPGAEPAQNTEGVWHYTCPKGCAGGGASAGPCGTCGTTLVHNTGYHSNNSATKVTPPPGSVQIDPNAGAGQVGVPPAPKVTEPAQNAKGVWHYTCPSGCAGGGGAAGPCGSCGATLVHNGTYHQ